MKNLSALRQQLENGLQLIGQKRDGCKLLTVCKDQSGKYVCHTYQENDLKWESILKETTNDPNCVIKFLCDKYE